MRNLLQVAVALLAIGASAADNKTKPTTTSHAPECTATSSTSNGVFFDLRPDRARKSDNAKTPAKAGVNKDYHARGYDYGKNFTLNICGAVVDPVDDVVGVGKTSWANVSAYYEYKKKVYSIGSQSVNLKSRGRKLVLQYAGGSPCGPSKSKRAAGGSQKKISEDDDDDDDDEDTTTMHKSTTISFICDRDQAGPATISFVGTDQYECAYFFEARSAHACTKVEPHKPGSVGPGSVFGLIVLIAVLVYAIGGVFYNRTVAHARGWRQLPNYSLWAGIWSFFSDMFVILFSSCTRMLPGRSSVGYNQLNTSRHRNSDAENRLIDQLDEEWED